LNGQKKGKGVIDFYMYLTSSNYLETIKQLNNYFICSSSSPKKDKLLNYNKIKKCLENDGLKEKENKNIDCKKIPLENKNNIKYIKDYLVNERFISYNYVKYLINKEYISADNNKNCIFYNEDKTYAFLRNIKSNFKQHAGESNFIVYKNDISPLYLFESVIDMISYIDINKGLLKGIFACTGGNMMVNKIEKLINNDIKEIIYCFDNDLQGKNITETIKDILKNYNIKHNIIVSTKKDWNEDLKTMKNK
jgi:hypothetical protein